MSNITITEQDSGYKISVQPTTVKIGVGSISGYGPKGDKGDTGATGATGPQGPAGDPASIADVPGLTEALAGKANVVHTHILDDITDFEGSVLAGGTF